MTAVENKILKFQGILVNHEIRKMYRLRTLSTYRNVWYFGQHRILEKIGKSFANKKEMG